MKKLGVLVLAGLVILGFLGKAEACTTYPQHVFYSGIYEADMRMSSFEGPWKDNFTLTLDDFTPGGKAHISSANLILKFKDDIDSFNFDQFAAISYNKRTSFFDISRDCVTIPIFSSGLFALDTEGKITFLLRPFFGEFYFKSAQIVAKGTSCPGLVPIPGTMWLFGPMLLIFTAVRRQLQPQRTECV